MCTLRTRSIYLGAITAIVLTISFQEAARADDSTTTISIIKNAQGRFVFGQPAVTIKAGQSIKWVTTIDGMHDLVADTAADPFTDTGSFDSTNPPTRTFSKPGVIHYHCMFHPATMKGTITVQ